MWKGHICLLLPKTYYSTNFQINKFLISGNFLDLMKYSNKRVFFKKRDYGNVQEMISKTIVCQE